MSIFPLFPLMLAVTPTAAGEELAFTTFRARGFTVPVTGLWFAAGQARSAVPLGGLGTGYLDLNSDGSFGRATLHNNWLAPQPPPPGTFFALFTALEGKRQTRLLQTTGGWGQPGIPGLRYWGHVPMVDLEYEAAPAELSLRAFGPLVPGDYETSALPAAMFSFRACNPTDAPLTVSLLFSFAPQREGPLVSQGNVAGLLRWARAELGPGECWEVPVVQVYGESEEALRHNLAAARREATALAAPATLGQGQTLHGPQLAEVFLDATGGFNWEANRREGAVFRGHPTVGQVFFAVHYRSDASRQAQLDFAPGRECVPVNWSPTQPTRLAADGRSAVTELTTTEGALRLTLVTAVGDSPAVLRRFTLRNLTNRPLTEVRLSVFVNFDLGGPGQEGDDRADFWPEEGAFHVTDDSTGLHAALAGTVLPEAVFVGTWHTAREALKAGRAVPLTALEEPIPAPEVFPLPHGRGLALPAGSRGEGYAIAAVGEGWEVTHLPAWNPAGKGQELWGSFAATGRLALTPDRPSSLSPPAAGALAARTLLPAQAERTVTFVLTWYFPRWLSSDGHELEHLYAARFPSARAVAEHVGPRQGDIAAAIVRWQTGIYASNLPGWLQDALLNGLYSLIRNTWWLSDGRFFHSESFTGCPITETLVCRFNGSFPLLMLWPELEKRTLAEFARFQGEEGAIPFGFGSPLGTESPMFRLQHPIVSTEWVAMVYRDYLWTGDREWLERMYPHVKRALRFARTLDREGDGLVNEHPGSETGWPAHQYYDIWPWFGTSAYVASIGLCAERAGEEMARLMGDEDFARECHETFARGQAAFEAKLWNGEYYRLYNDPGGRGASETCLTNQLAGQWYAYLLGLGELFPPQHIASVIRAVKRLNLTATEFGAVNGVRPDGTPDPSGRSHSQEVSPGEVWNFATLALFAGERKIALQAAEQVYRNIALRQGTPWNIYFNYSARTGEMIWGSDYYSNLCVWALLLGWEQVDCRLGRERLRYATTP